MRQFFGLCLLTCFIGMMVIASTALAQSVKSHYPIGKVAAIEGEAFIVSLNGNKRALKADEPIFFNAAIETGAGSRLMVLFIDDTTVTLGERAELVIDEFVFDPYESQENKGRFSVAKGAFYWVSGMIGKREEPDVLITTGIGTVGIRGTQFWGGMLDQSYGLLVTDGKVNFRGNFGSLDVPAGKGVFIGPENDDSDTLSKAGDIAEWRPETVGRAIETISFSTMAKEALDAKLKTMKKENIRTRHDYRGQMFPYKENPFAPRLKQEEDEFFSDEFMEMKNKKNQ